jgi:hypothetical protein
VRGDERGAIAEQLLVAEEIAECSNAPVIETAAWLVEDENVWSCGKCHDKCEPTPFAVGKTPG